MNKILFVIFFGQIILASDSKKKSKPPKIANLNISQQSKTSNPKTIEPEKPLQTNTEEKNLKSS